MIHSHIGIHLQQGAPVVERQTGDGSTWLIVSPTGKVTDQIRIAIHYNDPADVIRLARSMMVAVGHLGIGAVLADIETAAPAVVDPWKIPTPDLDAWVDDPANAEHPDHERVRAELEARRQWGAL